MPLDMLAGLDWRAAAIEGAAMFLAALGVCGAAALTQRTRASPYQLGETFGDSDAVVVSWEGREGYVRVGGELWRAQSKTAFARGEPVKVARKDGMLLRVTRA